MPAILSALNEFAAALFEFVHVSRIFKAQHAQAELAFVDTVAVEMNYVVGLAALRGALDLRFERGKGRRFEAV